MRHARTGGGKVNTFEVINALRKSNRLPAFGDIYVELLVDLLKGLDLRASVQKAGMALGVNVEAMNKNQDPMTACYIDSSFPAMLFFAYKYYDDPRKALLAGANAGGENVNRNALLGAVMGAAHGFDRIDKSLITGLRDFEGIQVDVDAFLKSLE